MHVSCRDEEFEAVLSQLLIVRRGDPLMLIRWDMARLEEIEEKYPRRCFDAFRAFVLTTPKVYTQDVITEAFRNLGGDDVDGKGNIYHFRTLHDIDDCRNNFQVNHSWSFGSTDSGNRRPVADTWVFHRVTPKTVRVIQAHFFHF